MNVNKLRNILKITGKCEDNSGIWWLVEPLKWLISEASTFELIVKRKQLIPLILSHFQLDFLFLIAKTSSLTKEHVFHMHAVHLILHTSSAFSKKKKKTGRKVREGSEIILQSGDLYLSFPFISNGLEWVWDGRYETISFSIVSQCPHVSLIVGR